MARRQRPLYEFVDPEELAADPVGAGAGGSSPSAEQRGNASGRVVAGLALLAGAVLFAVGVSQLRSPLSSVTHRAPSATRTVQRSVLPVAHPRRTRPRPARRRARLERAARPLVASRPSSPPKPAAPTHRAPAPMVLVIQRSAPRVTSTYTPRVPSASAPSSEFGFER